MIISQKNKKNLETVFLLSPIFWSWGVVFNFTDTKHFLSRLMAVVSVYCFVLYRNEIKYKWKVREYRVFIVFLAAIASLYSFLHVYNSGHFDFARVVWSLFFYFLLIPDKVFTKNNLKVILVFSSAILFMVAIYHHSYLHIGRVGFIVNAGPYAYIVGLMLILSSYLVLDCVLLSRKKESLILFLTSVSLATLLLWSQTRTSWLALVVVVIYVVVRFASRRQWTNVIVSTSILIIISLALGSTTQVQERLSYFKKDIAEVQNGNYESSFGTRIDMWSHGKVLFMSNPLLGIDLESERISINKAKEEGKIGKGAYWILNQERPNYHNVIVQALVKGGILGSVFAIFWCGLFLALRKSKIIFINRAFPALTIFTIMSVQFESQFTIYAATSYFYIFMVGFLILIDSSSSKSRSMAGKNQ
ncbi:O-antigen ligase family protein [Vibrio caribbeanicus]|uniref:O-antigen ligase family protein n=1 Tax=Vibrio caribbeanicus TaxID=701175 RepID=UPI0030D97E39